MLETLSLSWHIVRRNWLVYRKDFLANVSPTLAEPAFMMMSLGVGLGAFVADVHGQSYIHYLAPGLVVSTAMFTAFFETSYGFFVRMTFENIFKAMLTTPIGVREIIIGEFIWVSLKAALMALGVSLVLLALGLVANPLNLIFVPFVGILIALPLGAIGLLSTCYVKNINQFQTVYAFLISPLFYFSGIFFPVEQLPEWTKWIAAILPLYHGVQLSQSLYWDQHVLTSWSIHAPVLIGQAVIFVAWSYRQLIKKLQT